MANHRLIVLGSSLTALAVVRTAKRAGVDATILDSQRGIASYSRAGTFQLLKPGSDQAVVDAILSVAERHSAVVVADNDHWLRFLVHRTHELVDGGIRVLHPRPEIIQTCLSKSAFLEFCARHSIPAPRRFDVGSSRGLDDVQFPALIRPDATQHSAHSGLPKAQEVRDRVQLEYWLKRFEEVGVQPSVCESLLRPRLRQLSVGVARNSSGSVRTFLAEKIRPVAERCQGGTFVRPGEVPGIEDLAAFALDQLDYFGVAEVEVLYDPTTASRHIVEINARPWLQFSLPHACGVDLLGHALGPNSEAAIERDTQHAWMYFRSDLAQCFSRSSGLYQTGMLTLSEYVASFRLADVYAVWDREDPAPFLHSMTSAVSRGLRKAWRTACRVVGRAFPSPNDVTKT